MLRRQPTLGEEIANSITHGLALIAALAALPLLLLRAAKVSDPWLVTGCAIFGAALILMYASSMLYHALPKGRAKQVFRVLDHSAIYVLIAGTYTPFLLGVLRGSLGWTLLITVWTLAILGIVAKSTVGFRFPKLSAVLYIAMGWLALLVIRPLLEGLSWEGLMWLLAGGLCYTAGVIFFAAGVWIRYAHALWHLCVFSGSCCHFFAVMHYAVR